MHLSMKNDLSRHHLFTHAGCMDGSACAILFIHAGGRKENIHYVNAGQVDQYLSDGMCQTWENSPLLFVDVCPSRVETVDYLSNRDDVLVIDHHKSNESFASKHGFMIDLKNKACGCEHFRRWLVSNNVITQDFGSYSFDADWYVRMTRVVDDHDRWQMQIPFSLDMPKFFAFVGQKDFVERFMNVRSRFAVEKDSYWTPFEQDLMNIIRKNQERNYEATLRRMSVRERQWEGRTIKVAYVISDELNNSEMLNLYLERHPEVDIACQVNFHLGKVSVRSNQKVDLSRWTKQFGGGGHPDAAGHRIPDNLVELVIGAVHEL